MMNKQNIVKAMPTVLFITGIVGIFVSEVMAARDTLKAEKVIEDSQRETINRGENPRAYFVKVEDRTIRNDITDIKEVTALTWKCYIPTALVTTLTITSLVMSKRLTQKQILALSTAVASAGSLVGKYRKAILDRTDPDVLSEIDREVAEATMSEANPPVIEKGHLLSTGVDDLSDGEGEYLFFDPFTKVKFRSTKLAVLGAKYYLNRNFSLGAEAPLSMFYAFLGLNLPEEYRYAGWDVSEMEDNGYYWIDIDLVRSDKEDPETGEYYYILEYDMLPGDTDDNYYPFGNPLDKEGSYAV